MRRSSVFIIAGAIALNGCAQRITEENAGGLESMSWRASIERTTAADSLAAPPDLAGSLVMTPAANPTFTTVTIMLANATPNATHPWHVHAGACGSGGGIVGPPDAYTPLTIGANGGAQAVVTLPFSTPTVGDFSVNVHKSATEMGVVIACGALSPAPSPMR
jgi:hypothetical protein